MADKPKRLSPELRKMVERYKFVSSEEERYLGSVFAVPNSPRAKGYETELQDLARRFKEKAGVSIDEYAWKVRG